MARGSERVAPYGNLRTLIRVDSSRHAGINPLEKRRVTRTVTQASHRHSASHDYWPSQMHHLFAPINKDIGGFHGYKPPRRPIHAASRSAILLHINKTPILALSRASLSETASPSPNNVISKRP